MFGEAIQEAIGHGLGADAGGYMACMDADEVEYVLSGMAGLRKWALSKGIELAAMRSAVNIISPSMLLEAYEWAFDLGEMAHEGIADDAEQKMCDIIDLLEACGVNVARLRSLYEAVCRW